MRGPQPSSQYFALTTTLDLRAVRKADEELEVLAREVEVTSTTLTHLGRLLEDKTAASLYTQGLVDEAKKAFQGCEEAFKDVESTFQSVTKVGIGGKGYVSSLSGYDGTMLTFRLPVRPM